MTIPENLLSAPAATVKTGDRVWFGGQLRKVTRVENATPTDGTITWTIEGCPPVAVPATKKVYLERG